MSQGPTEALQVVPELKYPEQSDLQQAPPSQTSPASKIALPH